MNYYFSIDGSEVLGPCTFEEILANYHKGAFPSTTLFCAEGQSDWNPICSLLPPPLPPPLPTLKRHFNWFSGRNCLGGLVGMVLLTLLVYYSFVRSSQDRTETTPTPTTVSANNPESILKNAQTALYRGQYVIASDLLNRIVAEFPNSRQARSTHSLLETLRKGTNPDMPVNASEAQKIHSAMESFNQIKSSYASATPEKQLAILRIFGAAAFHSSDGGLESFSVCFKNLEKSMN